MTIFSDKHLDLLLEPQEAPCFSVYMPTHRVHPANAQDAQLFKTLVGEFDPVREQHKKNKDVQAIFDKFYALAADFSFWQHTLEGLAVFATPTAFHVYRLNRAVSPLAIVADSFHTKPLQRYLQSADRYHVLVLSTNKAKLYEGNRYRLDEVAISEDPAVPGKMIEALDHELRDLHATLAAYRTTTGELWDEPQNHGLKKTDINNDVEQFFRAVDRGVLEAYTTPSGLPLILAALPEHHHIFRRVCSNHRLMDEGIQTNASALQADKIRELAWEIFRPYYDSRMDEVINEFRKAAVNRLGADQLDQITQDAYDGKVETLLLEEDRIVPGKIIDRDKVVYHDVDGTELYVDDVLDDLGELVRRFGGEILVVPHEKMPATTGAAAINRY